MTEQPANPTSFANGLIAAALLGERKNECIRDIAWDVKLDVTFAFLILHLSHACAVRIRARSGAL